MTVSLLSDLPDLLNILSISCLSDGIISVKNVVLFFCLKRGIILFHHECETASPEHVSQQQQYPLVQTFWLSL